MLACTVADKGSGSSAAGRSQHQSSMSHNMSQTSRADTHQAVHQLAILQRDVFLQLPPPARRTLRRTHSLRCETESFFLTMQYDVYPK